MIPLAPIAGPAFNCNHHQLMREGQSLARRLGVDLALPDTPSRPQRPAGPHGVVLGAAPAGATGTTRDALGVAASYGASRTCR